jgi:hypothetical protein
MHHIFEVQGRARKKKTKNIFTSWSRVALKPDIQIIHLS